MVSTILKSMGVPVYDSDSRARSLYERDSDLLRQVVSRFGESILDAEGKLDRPALAAIVFNDSKALAELNALVHPAVKRDFDEWIESRKDFPLVVKEAAVLFESGAAASCDEVWLVTAPESIRLLRVMQRDGSSKEEVLARMHNQWSESKKMDLADAVIQNDQNHLLIPQIWKLWSEAVGRSQ